MPLYPHISLENCLNNNIVSELSPCLRCQNACPADAISNVSGAKRNHPRLNENSCTGCTACVTICPTDAITHSKVNPGQYLSLAKEVALKGQKQLRAACSALANEKANIFVPCHATWSPLLLASLAATGIKSLHIIGIDQCATCPLKYGAESLEKTLKDYATLNMALQIHLNIHHESRAREESNQNETEQEPELERRLFFRNLIPAIAKTIAITAAQANHTPDQPATNDEVHSLLPVQLQQFIEALPRLKPNFTPVPNMASIPLGAIQADEKCTACGECVKQCPAEALSLKPFGTNTILEFRPDACIGCMQCASVCPEDAIEPLPSISLPALATKRNRPLIMVAQSSKHGATNV